MLMAIDERHLDSPHGRRRPSTLSPFRIDLEEEEAFSLKVHGEGLKVECLSGMVWITAEGEDHVLGKGETFSTMRRGSLLAIVAFRRSEVRIGPVAASGGKLAEGRA